MNSYNENLHNSIVSSLNEQEIELVNRKAQLNASLFSLYYAQGALFTADSNKNLANALYAQAVEIEKEAINNRDVSNSLLATAQLLNTNVTTAMSNAALAAANVEIAANAIVKLAGDMGNIFSIINAADYGESIFDQANYAHELMNKTAYASENVSRLAMKGSQLVAEVYAQAIEDMSDKTNNGVTQIFATANSELADSIALLEANNQVFAQASKAERKSEGIVEENNASYCATESAYVLSNNYLNLGLSTQFPIDPRNNMDEEFTKLEGSQHSPTDSLTGEEYLVNFGIFQSAFKRPSKLGSTSHEQINSYPVNNYYIIIVKNSRKSTFNITLGENIISADVPKTFVKIEAASLSTQAVKIKLSQSQIMDSDGDNMVLGEEYVVFVLAELMNEYKKLLNDFENYLSAPSAPFRLYQKLATAESLVVKHDRTDSENGEKTVLTFRVPFKENDDEVEYRCMFLPVKNEIKGLLTASELYGSKAEKSKLIENSSDIDEQIAKDQGEIRLYEEMDADLQIKLDRAERKLKNTPERIDGKENPKYIELKKTLDNYNAQKKEYERRIKDLLKDIIRLEHEKERQGLTYQKSRHSDIGFIFNLTIAEQVTPANYYNPQPDISNDTNLEAGSKEVNSFYTYSLKIEPDTLDNFGNLLTDGERYVPVVLTCSNASPNQQKQYKNALSDFENTDSFVYRAPKM